MNNKIIPIISYFLLISCFVNKKKVLIEQVTNNRKISISENYFNTNNDSLIIKFPISIKIDENPSLNLRLLKLKINNRHLQPINDYLIYDEKGNVIFDFEKRKLDKDLQFSIVIQHMLISKKSVPKEILQKFDKLKRGDSLVLGDQNDIKIKFPDIINDLNKIKDSIIIDTYSKGQFSSKKKLKINW